MEVKQYITPMNIIYGIGIVLMMIGTNLNSNKFKVGFLFWMACNTIFFYKSYSEGSKFWMFLFAYNFVYAVNGWLTWI